MLTKSQTNEETRKMIWAEADRRTEAADRITDITRRNKEHNKIDKWLNNALDKLER